jgi:predicted transcriptional regulator of viral defense system
MTPRQQSILEIVARHTQGIRAKDLAVEAGIRYNSLSEQLRTLSGDGRLMHFVAFKTGLWCTPDNAKGVVAKIAADKKVRRAEAVKRSKISQRKDIPRWQQISATLAHTPMTIEEINAVWKLNHENARQMLCRLRKRGLVASLWVETHKVVWVPAENYERIKAESDVRAAKKERERRNRAARISYAKKHAKAEKAVTEFCDLPIIRILRSANEAPLQKAPALRWVFDLGGVAA